MPTVGKKRFDYDEEGVAAAEEEALATGQEVASDEDAIEKVIGDLAADTEEVSPELAEAPPEPAAPMNPGEEGEPTAPAVPPEVLTSLYEAVHGAGYDASSGADQQKMKEIEALIAHNPDIAQGLTDGSVSLTEAAIVLFRSVDMGGETPQGPVAPPENQVAQL